MLEWLDLLSEDERQQYWQRVSPVPLFWGSATDLNRVMDELLAVDRPKAAFTAIRARYAEIESNRLFRLLHAIALHDTEQDGRYLLEHYDVSAAFQELAKRPDVMKDELAWLEFLHSEVLDHTPTLEKQIVQSPELFVQLLVFIDRRRDGEQDPPHLRPADADTAKERGNQSYRVLSRVTRIPGADDDDKVNVHWLRDWLTRVRALAKECSRETVADIMVGQIFGRSQTGEDGIWPHEAIREVLEECRSDDIAKGMTTGRYNARGAVWRGKGGEQERDLAETYRKWAGQLAIRYNFTSRVLGSMAEIYKKEAES
jgi:hypothetical protein